MDYRKEEDKEEEIYENAKKEGFFKSLYSFLRHPFDSIFDIYWHIKDYNRLSQQCTDRLNKNTRLGRRITELNSQVKQLSQDLNSLGNEKNSLGNENKDLIYKLGIATSKNEAYRTKFWEYKDKVQNSEEFKQEKVKVDNLRREKTELEKRVNELDEKVKGFDTIYRQQKSVIANLHQRAEILYKELRRELENSLEQMAENDREESYVIIGGSGRIVASTSAFRKKFSFDDPDNPIRGQMYFKVLKPPADAPDYHEKGKYVYEIKYAFRDPEPVAGLETTIVDGKGEERLITFTRHRPFFVKIVKADKSGQELTIRNYFYTKVEVYDIGKWERVKEGAITKFKKILHIKNGESKELHEYVEERVIQRKQNEEKEEKEYNNRMAPVYRELVLYNPRKWNIDEFLEIEKEKGRDRAEVYLREELLKLQQKMGKKPSESGGKNELISQIIFGVIEHKTKQD